MPVQAQFAPQPVAVPGVMVDSQPLSVSVLNRTFVVDLDLNLDFNFNPRVEQGIATRYFIEFRAFTATQLFEDEAVTVRLIAIGSDDMISEDIRTNPIPAFATLDDPRKASLAVGTDTEFLIQASPSASTGTYQLDIEVEISDVDGGTVSGRLSEDFSIIASSLYNVSLGGVNLPLSFEVVPGPRRAFNLVFNEQTDANVPGSIIDSLTVVAGESAAEVWLSLEGVGGAFLGDDESVTVTVSLLSDNDQFTATDDDGGVLDTVVLTSTDNGLIRLDATANVGLDVAFSATVTAMVNPDQAGLPAADFMAASLSVDVVPREFRLVFEPAAAITVRGGNSTVVRVSLESIASSLGAGDVITVGIAASQFDGLSFAALEVMPATVMFTHTETSTEITLLSSSLVNADMSDGGLELDTVTVNVSASVLSAPAGVMFADAADLQVDIVKREFIVSFDPPDRVIIRKGELGAVTISMRGVDGSQLFGGEADSAIS